MNNFFLTLSETRIYFLTLKINEAMQMALISIAIQPAIRFSTSIASVWMERAMIAGRRKQMIGFVVVPRMPSTVAMLVAQMEANATETTSMLLTIRWRPSRDAFLESTD